MKPKKGLTDNILGTIEEELKTEDDEGKPIKPKMNKVEISAQGLW